MRRALAVAATIVLLGLGLTACGSDDEPNAETTPAAAASEASPSEDPTDDATEETPSEPASESPSEPSPTDDATDDATDDTDDSGGRRTIEIEIEGNRIEPNGRRVQVPVGETLTLETESDRPAELHVHSSPEQVLDVPRGESMLELTIDRPGLVDVEEHESGLVILRLEVS